MPRTIAYRLWIDWDFNGVYTDESAHLVRASGELRLTPPAEFLAGGKGIVDRCQLELRNPAGRFSPLNTAGPLYAYLQDGKAYHAPMALEVSIDDGVNYWRVFTGVAKIPQESGLTSKQNPMVTIDCRSRDELLLQRRISTSLAQFRSWAQAGPDEAQIIAAVFSGLGATPTAVDAGMVRIPFAWSDDESALEELWQLAAAAGGRVYCDADGTYRYENMAHWLTHATSLETLTRADYQNLQAAYADGDLYSVVTVEAASRQVGAWDVVWEPEEPVMVPPASNKKITARLQQPLYFSYGPEWQAVSGGGLDLGNSNNPTVVTMAATFYAQRAELTITNTSPYWAAYMRNFRIMGYPVLGGPSFEESRNSADHGSNGAFFAARGQRTRAVRGNAYVQSKAQAGMLASFLLAQSERPRLTYRLRGCPGKPWRRPGDRITIDDPSVMSAGRDAFVTAISWRLSSSGFGQDLEAVDAAQLYPHQAEGYFVVGTNTLGASAKRVFY